jgi:hypothetical protein
LSAQGGEQVSAAGYVQLDSATQQLSLDAWTARG